MKLKCNRAFTLIEVMVAIAIVAILATIVMMKMGGYAQDARSSKALAQLSSAIPSMISCWGNGQNVKSPGSGGRVICGETSSYGDWPWVGPGTDLETYEYDSVSSDPVDKSGWFFTLSSGPSDDGRRICCNSGMNNCKIQCWDGSPDWNDCDVHTEPCSEYFPRF